MKRRIPKSVDAWMAVGLVLMVSSGRVRAQDPAPELVADIGDGVPITLEDVFLSFPVAATLDGVAYFFVDDGIHGRELWRSDGTEEGTRLVLDLCPGSCGTNQLTMPRWIVASDDRIFFAANDGVHGVELWSSDGTPGGTAMVRDIWKGHRTSRPSGLAIAGDTLYFQAFDGSGRDLWVSDGTEPGTHPLAESPPDGFPNGFSASASLGGILIFNGGPTGTLWRSDGTQEGTFELSGLYPWQSSWSSNSPFMAFRDRIYLFASQGGDPHVEHLLRTDGTVAGTEILAYFEIGGPFAAGETVLYLMAADLGGGGVKPWRFDPLSNALQTLAVPEETSAQAVPGLLATLDDRLIFVARSPGLGDEPWLIEGDTVQLLEDIHPGTESAFHLTAAYPFGIEQSFVRRFDDEVLFLADDGHHGLELWSTDGTPQGTHRFKDLVPGPDGTQLAYHQGVVPLAATSAGLLLQTIEPDGTRALWVTAGTPSSTRRLAELNAQSSSILPSNPGAHFYANRPPDQCFEPVADALLFGAVDRAIGSEPRFVELATGAASAFDLTPGNGYSLAQSCRAHEGLGLVSLWESPEGHLWQVSPHAVSATRIADLAYGPEQRDAWTVFDGALYFAADGLWTTDGTPGSTVLVDPPEPFHPFELAASGGRLFQLGATLGVSDGTPGATTPIQSADGILYVARMVAFQDGVLFVTFDEDHGGELWRSAGTAPSTSVVRDIAPGPTSAITEQVFGVGHPSLTRIVPLGGIALFAADDTVHGEELWRTDGTEAGTVMVADLFPGDYPSVPTELTRVGGYAYFVAETPGLGRELWRSDGTAGGTTLVADLVPGPGSSIPERLTAAGSELYFSAWTPERGREAWRVRDLGGGAFSVKALPEIAPGPLSSSPEVFREIGGAIYTAANDNVRGFELWRLREEDVVFSDGFEGTTTDVWTLTSP